MPLQGAALPAHQPARSPKSNMVFLQQLKGANTPIEWNSSLRTVSSSCLAQWLSIFARGLAAALMAGPTPSRCRIRGWDPVQAASWRGEVGPG